MSSSTSHSAMALQARTVLFSLSKNVKLGHDDKSQKLLPACLITETSIPFTCMNIIQWNPSIAATTGTLFSPKGTINN